MKMSVTIRNVDELHRMINTGIPTENMIAFVGVREPSQELYSALTNQNILAILGTLGNLDRRAEARGDQVYREYTLKGADIIATDRPLEVFQSLLELPVYQN